MGLCCFPEEGGVMRRLFVPLSAVQDGRIIITGSDAHHIRNVLRMKPGDTLKVSAEDSTVYTCVIEKTGEVIETRIADLARAAEELPCRITLFQCLPKKDKMEFIIQKAVELGVHEIVPVISERTIVRLDAKKKAARTERWNAVAKSAAEQSGRCIIPAVREPVSFVDALRLSENCGIKIMPYENAKGMEQTRRVMGMLRTAGSACVIIGPEGGFSNEEVKAAGDSGFEMITLGKRILRTETAGMTALSIIMYSIED